MSRRRKSHVARSQHALGRAAALGAKLLRPLSLRNRLRSHGYGLRAHLPVELLVEPSDVVIQVGTPHPSTLERLARIAGPGGFVLAVEAEESNAQSLSERAGQLCDEGLKVQVVHAAAGPASGEAVLRVSSARMGDHSMADSSVRMDNDERDDVHQWAEQVVPVVALDDLDLPRPPTLLIVTVNGAEVGVLQGAAKWLGQAPQGARAFVKAHARVEDSGTGVSTTIADEAATHLRRAGFEVRKTRSSASVSQSDDWTERAGDLFAYKP